MRRRIFCSRRFRAWACAALAILTAAATDEAASASDAGSLWKLDSRVEAPILGVSLLATAWLDHNASNMVRLRCQDASLCHPSSVNALDRGAIGNASDLAGTISDISVALAVATPLAASWYSVGFSRAFAEDAVIYAEVLSLNSLLVTVAKYSVQRPLPRTYAGDPELANGPAGYRSFYSGHVSATFALLSAGALTWNYRHDSGAWPWLVTGAFGTVVAVERVLAGRHFPSDVLTGAVAGVALGLGVPLWHRGTTDRPAVIAAVAPVPQGGILVTQWVF